MHSRRPSSARASMSMRSFDDGDLSSFTSRLGARPSSLIRPSMHSEFMQRKDSDGPNVRRRSLSTESDRSGKPRPSVPLLYASTISSMSTLSSSFYQYDSTGAVLPEIAPTPASSKGSSDHHSRSNNTHHSKKPSSQEPTLQLPPAQQRAIRKDAHRMARELIVEQVQALDLAHKRLVIKRNVAIGSMVAETKGIQVFEKPALGAGLPRLKKNNTKRYTAQWKLNGTMDEVVELLRRDDSRSENYMGCQSILSPETVNCKLLWRDNQSNRSGYDDEDDSPVLRIEPQEETEEFVMYSDRGGRKSVLRRNPRPRSAVSIKSKASSSSRRRHGHHSKPLNWLGINWWVQHMPVKLSRDRDFIVLENQREFETPSSDAKGPLRRGFVHLRHSVNLADMAANEKKLMSPFVRGQIIQSGLVIVESDEPGVLDVASTLEIDYGGHLSANQQRQIIVKRLQSQLESLSEMLWKVRLLKTQKLFGQMMPRLDKKSGDAHRCYRCQHRASRWGSRRVMEPCRSCEHLVCANCSQQTEFQAFLVAAALPTRQHNLQSVDSGDLKARVCSHCVVDYSRPRLYRHQSSADTYSAEIDDHFDLGDDDEAYNERGDAVRTALPPSFHYRKQHEHQQRSHLSTRRSSASIHSEQEWQPTRSSRIAEDMVDDFLTSFKTESAMMPEYPLSPSGPFSPSALSDSEPQSQLSPPVPQAAPVTPSVVTPSAWQRRPSGAGDARRPSVSSYTPLQGPDHTPPRRKLSIFETIPEPAPRKNIVLYEV